MPRIRRVTRQTRAEPPATSVSNHYLSRPSIQIYCENREVCTLPHVQTFTLSHACRINCNLLTGPTNDRAIQLWATSWLLYHLTKLFNCELPLDYSTTWLSYSSVSYLLITLPLDWAIQVWATSWLLYHSTELFKYELPLDYSTTWLSYSMVSYLLITLPLD